MQRKVRNSTVHTVDSCNGYLEAAELPPGDGTELLVHSRDPGGEVAVEGPQVRALEHLLRSQMAKIRISHSTSL